MPVKQLFLLRHAKSSWEDAELADHDRPLAPRGRRAAKLIAEHLRRERLAPALVLCSSALRARETLERIAPALAEAAPVQIEGELYGASEQRLLEHLRAMDDGIGSMLLIGHNPAVEQLALLLAGSGKQLPAVRRKYPTGALATLQFNGSWRDLGPGSAELT
ncbi:MAG: SixA phosphatase family protein, partial [Pseudonocardiaceae bacterium]